MKLKYQNNIKMFPFGGNREESLEIRLLLMVGDGYVSVKSSVCRRESYMVFYILTIEELVSECILF